jgi:hypothetical protein
MRLASLTTAGLGIALLGAPALAHHSFAMFEAQRSIQLEGTVKQFLWTNPHTWILMNVKNTQGVDEQWAIEMGGPAGLARDGWSPTTLTPGMSVRALIHPLKDGSRGGQFMVVWLPDGSMKGNPAAPPGNDAGGRAP